MFRATRTRLFRANTQVNDRPGKRQHTRRSRRFALESLEPREMLSATPEFQVLNDATTNVAYRYSQTGAAHGSYALAAANATPRGTTSMVGVEKTWVIDANRNVYVYDSNSGAPQGSWAAGSMPNHATPEGIATNGTDIWIVDSRSDKVFKYTDAASRTSGSQNAASSFSLYAANYAGVTNLNPKDMVTDGASLWVVDDSKTDRVFKYSMTGSLNGYWSIDSANKTPTGITLDPVKIGDMWIADSVTDRVYKYTAATGRSDFNGSQSAAGSFALTTGNSNPQGLVIPGRAWTETPYVVEWVRQFGSPGDDAVRGVAADRSGNIYLSGGTSGSLVGPNANGLGVPYLAQYDTSGNRHWIQQGASIAGVDYGGVRVVTDSQGNIFQVVNVVSGSFAGAMQSYDPAGTLRWETPLPVGEGMFDVTVDAAGFAYSSSYEGNNVHIRKFDGATGGIVWQVELNTGGATNSSGMSADQMGNIYVAAWTGGALLGPNEGSYDALVAKISEAGSVLWTRQYGSAGSDLAFYAAADAFGNVYSGGRTDSSLGGPSAGGFDIFLAKHDGAGNLQWTRQYGTSGLDTRADMWVDPQGNVYRAVETTGSLGGAHLGGYDIVVTKLDPMGNVLWETQVGTSADDQVGGGIWGDAQGNLYVTGSTTGSWVGNNAGNTDAFVIKLSPAAALASTNALNSLTATMARSDSANSPSNALAIGTASTSTSSTTSTMNAISTANHTTSLADISAGQADAMNPLLTAQPFAPTPRDAELLRRSHVDQVLASWKTAGQRSDAIARHRTSTLFADETGTLDAAFNAVLAPMI